MFDPYTLPSNPFDSNSQCPEVREAIRLHEAAHKATTVVGTAYAGIQEARDNITAAQRALDDAILTSSQTGQPHKDEVKLARALHDAKDAADPEIHNRRIAIAVQAQREAVTRYHSYVRDTLPVLLDTLRPEAHEAAGAVAEAVAKIEPVRQRRSEIAGRVFSLIGIARATPMTHGINLSVDEATHWTLAQEETEAPLPSDTVLRYYYPEEPQEDSGGESEENGGDTLESAYSATG